MVVGVLVWGRVGVNSPKWSQVTGRRSQVAPMLGERDRGLLWVGAEVLHRREEGLLVDERVRFRPWCARYDRSRADLDDGAPAVDNQNSGGDVARAVIVRLQFC